MNTNFTRFIMEHHPNNEFRVARSQIDAALRSGANLFTAAKRLLATRSGTPQEVLGRLGRASCHSIRRRVAENPTTDAATLSHLSQDCNSEVRSAVAENPSTAKDVVEQLAADHNADVRYSMAADTNTSEHLLKRLATDENPYVQERAQRTQARKQSEPDLKAVKADQGKK